MRLGKILAKSALDNNKNTSWFPSYGAEMRGGTAHCFVKISDKLIASPFVDYPDIAIILNQPSWDKFKKCLKPESLAILNQDLINSSNLPKGRSIISLPLNKIANSCGNLKAVNIVALGLLAALKPDIFKKPIVMKILKQTFSQKDTLEVNLKGFLKGQEAAPKKL